MTSSLGSEKSLDRGWHILRSRPGPLNRLSLEWDYCMVHDRAFTGSIGYVVADPAVQKRPWLKRWALLPSGVCVAIAGQFANGHKVANFLQFDFDQVQLSANTKSLSAHDPAKGCYATLTASHDLQLEGRTQDIAYQLTVQEDVQDLPQNSDVFTPVTGRDMGWLPNERWTVDVIWPRTQVTGYINDLSNNQPIRIAGHGYRENSFGQWLFFTGGWDFAVVSDQQSGVRWVWQTYHRSQDLSYLDLSFPAGGIQKTARFWARAGQLRWRHPHWQFDPAARQHCPLDTVVHAHNEEYIVDAKLTMGSDRVALLHKKSWYTQIYVIFALFPWVEGTIYRAADYAPLVRFSGQGGGEYATLRSLKKSSMFVEH